MANTRNVSQLINTVSIPREKLKDIASNDNLSKLDYKVLLHLFASISGFSRVSRSTPDPENYTHIEIDTMAFKMQVKKKDIKKSLKNLIELGFIEEGNSETSHGYRFTF